jgi:hypothetical protein
LLAAAARAGTRRVIAQSNVAMYEPPGSAVKTEEDPPASRSPSPVVGAVAGGDEAR